MVAIMCLQDQYEITAVRLSQKIQGQCLESKYSEDDVGKKITCRLKRLTEYVDIGLDGFDNGNGSRGLLPDECHCNQF